MACRRTEGLWVAFVIAGFLAVSAAPELHSQTPNADEASCRAFVQQFYDWYLTKSIVWYGVAKLKPQVLSPELFKLLKKEDDTQTACKCIDHLDADPFLNSQDPDPKYIVKRVAVVNGRCNAIVRGNNGGSEVRPELTRTSTGWVFINFHYSFYSEDGKRKLFPDDDLVHMLKR
jgi:hypothetical protein